MREKFISPPTNGGVCEPKNTFKYPTDDVCWDKFKGTEAKFCSKYATTKTSGIPRTAFVGAACGCRSDVSDGNDGGFSCVPRQLCAEKSGTPTAEVTEIKKQCSEMGKAASCQIDPDTKKPACFCNTMTNYNNETKLCEPKGCDKCLFGCHKHSRCLSDDKKRRCAECTNGYEGFDGVICNEVDECTTDDPDKMHDCDEPRAVCQNADPLESYEKNGVGIKYTCECKEGWRGDKNAGFKCKPCKDTNECNDPNACGQNTNCLNTEGSYSCECKSAGFRKKAGDPKSCEDKNECSEDKPCHQFAECNNTIGSFECTCKSGFVGNGMDCKPDKDAQCAKCDAQSTTCSLNDHADSYTCNCKTGFLPIQSDPNKCVDEPDCPDPSKNNCDKTPGFAKCEDVPAGSFTCVCNPGYTGNGKVCQPLDPCVRDKPCADVSGSNCVNNNGVASCDCKTGFVRLISEKNNKHAACLSNDTAPVNNCSLCNNATMECHQMKDYPEFYECSCKEGYQKTAIGTCTNTNECINPTMNNCDSNANCHDLEPATHGGKRYECVCKNGYDGDGTKGKCVDVNECEKLKDACPKSHMECVNTVGSFACVCKKGYQMFSGVDICTNINECADGFAQCCVFSTCHDKDPFFECVCDPGFTSDVVDPDGKVTKCKNVDECKDPALNECDKQHGNCTDTIGSYLCDCGIGFVRAANGKSCNDKDECALMEHNCDPSTENCVNTKGSYKCDCKEGLMRDASGAKCIDHNECEEGTHMCMKHSICKNTFASYTCTCEDGYNVREGTNPLRPVCDRDDICKKSPQICGPGVCESKETAPFYKCHCSYSAIQLDQTRCVYPTYCDQKYQCPNESDCQDNKCDCTTGYRWIDPKPSDPYTVESLNNREACKPINPCAESQTLCPAPKVCINSGPGKHKCDCQSGYEFIAPACIDIDECNLAVNGATCPFNSTCVNLPGTYYCKCNKPHWTARTTTLQSKSPECIDVDECATGANDCASKNATCENTIGLYKCNCQKGYKHQAPDYERCTNVNECQDGTAQCDKNAICSDLDGSYDCKCKPGFFGDGMEYCADIDECNPAEPKHNCHNDTQNCNNTVGSFVCSCKPGFTVGKDGCEDINECQSPENNDCGKKGGTARMKCVNTPGSYKCICPDGYVDSGPDTCEDINECKDMSSGKVCPTGAADICINQNGTWDCDCLNGYAKSRECAKDRHTCPCKDINECRSGVKKDGKAGPACGPAAKCDNQEGSYKCSCASGYDGDAYTTGCKLADICKAANPCNKETEDCRANAADPSKAVCDCKKSLIRDKTGECQKNPCLDNNGGCGTDASCRPRSKEHGIETICSCRQGFKLDDKKNCVHDDQCKCSDPKPPKGSPCKSTYNCTAEHMLCLDKTGDFTCLCEDGYKLNNDKTKCVDCNECAEGRGCVPSQPACDANAHCENHDGGYSCICKDRGQTENFNRKCIKDTGCVKERNCKDDEMAYCKDIDADHAYCQCTTGNEGNGVPDGPKCKPKDFCKEFEKEHQSQSPCNRTTEICINRPNKYVCECKDGYQRSNPGEACENVDECKTGKGSCPLTKICHDLTPDFECICPNGTRINNQTDRCDNIDECAEKTDTCDRQKERCVDMPLGFRCECDTPRYKQSPTGADCINNNECTAHQYDCPQNSECRDKDPGYDCDCLSGFASTKRDSTNKTIECSDIPECSKTPSVCPPNSKCLEKIGSYECKCNPPTIQHGLRDCIFNTTCPDKCNERASCLSSTQTGVYNCTCNSGFTGDGVKCTPINECADGSAQCHKYANCTDKTPGYDCSCIEPYEGDGKINCTKTDYCTKPEKNDCPTESVCKMLEERKNGHWVTCNCTHLGFQFNTDTRHCEDINECLNTTVPSCPTKPDGIKCENTQGSFTCICPEGYTFNRETKKCADIDECPTVGQQTCGPYGKCNNTEGSFDCICSKGFEQKNGSKACVDKDECTTGSDNCDKKTSDCRNTVGGFVCDCHTGKLLIPGKTNSCEDRNECLDGSNNCTKPSQLCHNLDPGFMCNCSNGYEAKGDKCSPTSDCKDPNFECGANAFCSMRNKRDDPSQKVPTCICQDGYYGNDPKVRCDPVPDCKNNNQCPANSHCVETQAVDAKSAATYMCVCNPGFAKQGAQCVATKPCQENHKLCGKKAICEDKEPGYVCHCEPGHENTGDEKNAKCEPLTCAKIGATKCHVDANCVDVDNGFMCKCKDGFTGAGTSEQGCVLIDQCNDYHPCSQYATCVNEPRGSFTCTCKAGWTGNGTHCIDINECVQMADKACDKNADCHNTQGSYRCKCKDGYDGNGSPGQCADINECKDPQLNKCDPVSTTCENTDGSYKCNCKTGYEKSVDNDHACTDINECLVANTTQPSNEKCGIHHCSNQPGDYRCDCLSGYQSTENGHKCIDIDECQQRPCHVDADCLNSEGSYLCTCKAGFTGNGVAKCDPVDLCGTPERNKCDNSTTKCVQLPLSVKYRCDCQSGFEQPPKTTDLYYSCIDKNECVSGEAKYDPLTEVCNNTVGSFNVICKEGLERKNDTNKCVDINECAQDAGYVATVQKYKELILGGQKGVTNWQDFFVKPTNDSSAYGICYNKALKFPSGAWRWTKSQSTTDAPLPWCKNTAYDSNHKYFINQHWKGFECDCPPGQNRSIPTNQERVGPYNAERIRKNDDQFKCTGLDPCLTLVPDCVKRDGEGNICINERGTARCVCDTKNGWNQRSKPGSDSGTFCSRHECEVYDSGPPQLDTTKKFYTKCNNVTYKFEEKNAAQHRLIRNATTNEIENLIDVNSCGENPDYCCPAATKRCEGENCVQCVNTNYTKDDCLCRDASTIRNANTCACEQKCDGPGAWFYKCQNMQRKCDLSIVKQGGGPVCSRILAFESISDWTPHTFPSMLDLLQYTCTMSFYCGIVPSGNDESPASPTADDLKKSLVFNYDGACIKGVDAIGTVKCPFGDKPTWNAETSSALCPFKVDKWPIINPMTKADVEQFGCNNNVNSNPTKLTAADIQVWVEKGIINLPPS